MHNTMKEDGEIADDTDALVRGMEQLNVNTYGEED